MMQISIPKPCHEDWNAMTPNQQGRHCNVCAKTVVDFTGMSDEEVKYFFVNKKKEESVCGRFKNEQLCRIKIELPYNIYTITMPLWKQFLTACLLAFSSMLFSCDALVGHNTTGETRVPNKTEILGALAIRDPEPVQEDTAVTPACSTIKGDTIYAEGFVAGEITVAPPVTQGVTIIEPVQETYIPEILPAPFPAEQPDTVQTIVTGKVAVDTSRFTNANAVDTSKTVQKQNDCGNDFINL